MTRYALLRLWLVVPTLAGVLLFVFALLELVPGDPAAVFLGENATPEAVASLREELGLDRPLPVRLFDYAREVLRGDLGQSIFQREPVLDIVLRRLPATVELALAAFLLAVLSGVALGTMAALWRGNLRGRRRVCARAARRVDACFLARYPPHGVALRGLGMAPRLRARRAAPLGPGIR